MKLKFAGMVTLLATAVVGQGAGQGNQRGLLYTPKYHETSTQGVATPALNEVRSNEVQYVVPIPGGPYDSEQFAPLQAYITMMGDRNADGDRVRNRVRHSAATDPGDRRRHQRGRLHPRP